MKAIFSKLWTQVAPMAQGLMFLEGHIANTDTLSEFASSERPATAAKAPAETPDADLESLRGTPAYARLELHWVLRNFTAAHRA